MSRTLLLSAPIHPNSGSTRPSVNASGRPDNLSRALSSGKLLVTTVAPSGVPPDLAGLLAYRAVILENVPASQVGSSTLDSLPRAGKFDQNS